MAIPDFKFSESQFRFTDPVRYFTSTDPYYWEVDNIPLKQLQENDLWLKDQIEDGFKNLSVSFDRNDFLELKPFADGEDNIVKVKPGRYSARINDASQNPRLQILERVMGEVFSEPNKWRFASYSNTELAENIDRIISEVADDALFMNGLIERVFTQPVKNPYEAFDEIVYDENMSWTFHSPLMKLFSWPGSTYPNSEFYADVSRWSGPQGMRWTHLIETLFMKFWRGVTRISIVDVAEELSIEIPPFDLQDFNYLNTQGGTPQSPDPEKIDMRIDLVFIYSKPIDASSVKIIGTNQTTPRVITKPVLGLVRGAGIRHIKDTGNSFAAFNNVAQAFDENDNLRMLASPADAQSAAGGFDASGIRGSFPSPDDLMNVAPLLLESLEISDPRLVGQSVLPIAYVIVRKNPTTNEFGEALVTNNDIIDIRPFFRTAELTYNERAGIAASIPQLSISNPVVSDLKLKYVTNEIETDYISRISQVNVRVSNLSDEVETRSRVVGRGVIRGGAWGPEGALTKYYENNGLSRNIARQFIKDKYNYPSLLGGTIDSRPDWDVSDWAKTLTEPGRYLNDSVNIWMVGNDNRRQGIAGAAGDRVNGLLNTLAGSRLGDSLASEHAIVFFTKKTILLDVNDVSGWMDHYTVNVNYLNCAPTTTSKHIGQSHVAGLWVERQKDQFTIYAAWVGRGEYPHDAGPNRRDYWMEIYTRGLTGKFRNDRNVTCGHMVMTSDLDSLTQYKHTQGGICVYPSVEFTITGHPRQGIVNLYPELPTITLT